jgi:prepilin-type processing-associated H-X9-DG protein
LAILNYEAKYHHFPPAYTVDKQGRRMHSWRVLVLEFLDPDLYAQYDFSRPWNSPANLAFAKKMKKDGPYRCPLEDIKEPSWTSYVMFVGPTAFSNGPTGRKLEEITEGDGTTNTVAVVEMSPSGILWTAPYDLNVAEMSFKINDPDQACPRSCHGGGLNMVFADGHVEYFGEFPDAEKFLKAVTTINGGEDMSKFSQ